MDLAMKNGGKKKPEKVPSATVAAEEKFKSEFARKFPGVPQLWSYGRDRRILKDLIAQSSEALVVDVLIPAFFACRDRWLTRNYTVPDLKLAAQRLLLNLSQGGQRLHPRTAANVDEALKAVRKDDE